MLKWILGVIVAYIVGSIIMMGIHFASQPLYPPPEGVEVWNPKNREAVEAWMKTLPAGAFVLAMVAHWIGAAAATAMAIVGRGSLKPALVMGVLFTAAGVYNVIAMPSPEWFPFVDIPGYLIVA